jgi:hypothetical protein
MNKSLVALVATMSFLSACGPIDISELTSDTADDCMEQCGSADTGEPADTDTDSDSDTDVDTDTGEVDTGTEAIDADGDGYADTADCDDSDATVNPSATEADNGIDDDCDGSIDEGFEEPESDLVVTITAPGGMTYGSMLCHVEFLDDTDGDGSFSDEYFGWEYSWVENWVSQTTLETNPGSIDGIRLNCTICPDELTLAEEPWSPEAEAMGCTWLVVNGSGSTNGAVATWYFGETFGSSLVSVAGGTSVLVDLR